MQKVKKRYVLKAVNGLYFKQMTFTEGLELVHRDAATEYNFPPERLDKWLYSLVLNGMLYPEYLQPKYRVVMRSGTHLNMTKHYAYRDRHNGLILLDGAFCAGDFEVMAFDSLCDVPEWIDSSLNPNMFSRLCIEEWPCDV